MTFRKLLAGLLLSALTLGLNAVEPAPKKPAEQPDSGKKAAERSAGKGPSRGQSERTCALSVTWWEEPTLTEGEFLELGVQTDRGVIRIAPAAMSSGGTLLYEGPTVVSIVRRALLPDPNGKPGAGPVETWLPFTSFKLGNDDHEVLAILFSNQGQVLTRSININQERFPFGGFHIYNYSKTRLLCNMGNKVFNAEPSGLTLSPLVMTKREVVNFFLGVQEEGGKMRIIYRAPLILTEKVRRLYFILENQGAESENRFVTRTIMQHISSHKTVETLRNLEASPMKQGLTQETPPEPKIAPPTKTTDKPGAVKGA
jgi:hypothetical protein